MALKDIKRLSKKDQPFFLAVGFRKPHLPFTAPKRFWDLYDRSQFVLPANYKASGNNIPPKAYHNSAELRAYRGVPKEGPLSDSLAVTLWHGYYACISYVDHLAGRLLDELKNLGLENNTIVVAIGDHGYNMGEHGLWCKHCNFNTSLRSMMMVRNPGGMQGVKSDAITEFVDIFPTLCDLTGLQGPDQLEGQSFSPLMFGDKKIIKDYAVARWANGLTLINNNYAYTEWRNNNDSVLQNMLFDHSTDPGENNNIAGDEKMKGEIDKLSRMLVAKRGNWLQK
jgi:arylsulfatase A-like enzyme